MHVAVCTHCYLFFAVLDIQLPEVFIFVLSYILNLTRFFMPLRVIIDERHKNELHEPIVGACFGCSSTRKCGFA